MGLPMARPSGKPARMEAVRKHPPASGLGFVIGSQWHAANEVASAKSGNRAA